MYYEMVKKDKNWTNVTKIKEQTQQFHGNGEKHITAGGSKEPVLLRLGL